MECSIVLPCLNEEANIAYVIDQAREWMSGNGVTGEIIVVDNGSIDKSTEIARAHGAAVIFEKQRGYGYALRKGLSEAKGAVIIFGDADGTYDLSDLGPFYKPLSKNECDLVIGNRFAGRMEKGAMKGSHRIGVSFLSLFAGRRFGVPVRDYHCGIRGIRKDALEKCLFRTGGMEFATEMIAEAGRQRLRIQEIPVALRVSRFKRRAKLRPVRDGFRHLSYILFGKNKAQPVTKSGKEERKELVILNYQYWIPTFLQAILYYAGTVYDKVYYLYPVAGTDKQIRRHIGKIYFIGIPRKNIYPYIVKLPIRFAERDTREQLQLAIRHKLPMMKLLESIVVHNLWADALAKAVSGLFEKALIRKENTVVLAAWFSAEAMAGARIKKKYPEVRFVSLAHSYEVDRKRNPYADHGCNRMKHHYCDHVYFISELMHKQYCGNAARELKKGSVMYLGSRKLYPERRVPGSTDGIFRILSCSNVIAIKRIDRIIDALALWDSSVIEWTHFGGGILLEEMKKRAEQKLGNKSNIRFCFMGEVKNRVIHEHYNSQTADLFINVSESEGLPISLMECMSYGVPAIATKAGGNTEIVTDSTGFLLDAEFTDEDLCSAIKRYMGMSVKEKEEMRTAAYERWKADFNASVNIVNLLRGIRG